MIPLQLRIAGFLSYHDPVELDFNSFELACISGHNGAGKSSLLDAMTWVLFGEARGKSSDIINLNQDVKAAEVTLTFGYENNVYRVQRSLPRNKSTVLEFQILDNGPQTTDHRQKLALSKAEGSTVIGQGNWRPLTERTTRETQARIEQTLRLDYETFVNASFFLQGKADQFTQQNASKRKDVLSSILGLEIWETYKARTAAKRKSIEDEVIGIESRIAEIDAELAEEDTRRSRFKELDASLKQLSSARAAQEDILENIKKTAAVLTEQHKLVETLSKALNNSRSSLQGLEARLAEKEAELAKYADLVSRAKEVESAYKAWQKARTDVENMDAVAAQFREHEKERAPLLEVIAVERTKLEQEKRSLLVEEEEVSNQRLAINDLQIEIKNAEEALAEAETRVVERNGLESERNATRERQAALKVENETLKAEMNQLKERIETLKSAEGATCPLCGQELSREHRKSTLKQLESEGKEKGDRYRSNLDESKAIAGQIKEFESRIVKLASAEDERMKYVSEVSQLAERMESLQTLAKSWESTGRKRLKELEKILGSGKYAVEEQRQLARLDKELAKLGYDASAHDAARQSELNGRSAEEEHNNLKTARELSRQIEGEIENLVEERGKEKEEIAQQERDYDAVAGALAEAEAQSPDLEEAERELLRLREQENLIRDEVGMARQRVDILATLRTRKTDYTAQRDELQKQIARHKTLERAFGKDGVPALLIEQALPQIESKANDLLDRLSDGQMSIRFVTQAEFKDKKRDDLKETLDIQISDGAGMRAYEMYSGGEAFRVNFAIRLALSEILAQRKGARLQTLVIDEGFGSQDAQGRQRLIEAINIVKNDFAKILVITHLDELKDAFPNRIEVEKTERGSTIKVI